MTTDEDCCWHFESGSPCDWDVCRQPERLAAGDRGEPPLTADPRHLPHEPDEDTLPQWLFQRYRYLRDGVAWENLPEGDQLYWEHEAAAVRRAVHRGGFKEDPPPPGGRGMFDFNGEDNDDRTD